MHSPPRRKERRGGTENFKLGHHHNFSPEGHFESVASVPRSSGSSLDVSINFEALRTGLFSFASNQAEFDYLRVSEAALGTMTFGDDWGWVAAKDEEEDPCLGWN